MFFFKQKTAYEMRISDWSSDVCSSDLIQIAIDQRCRNADQQAKRKAVGAGDPELAGDLAYGIGTGELVGGQGSYSNSHDLSTRIPPPAGHARHQDGQTDISGDRLLKQADDRRITNRKTQINDKSG